MSESSYPRIVITGIGCVSPLGNNAADFWDNLIASKSGIGPITKLDTPGLRNENGGEIQDFDWSAYGEEGDCDEATQFAYAAAQEVVDDAGLGEKELAACGLVFSTNFGGAASWEAVCEMLREGMAADAELFRQFTLEDAADYTANRWNNTGPRVTLTNACSSGGNAIGLAMDWLRLGRATRVVCGGYDGLGLSSLAGLSILRTVSPDGCRPFDKNRNGTIFGEGAAMLVLETEQEARARGSKIYAEVLGWGLNNNAHHLTAPDKDGAGLEAVMRAALNDAGVAPDAVDYINAHGTGTQYNDLAETQAIKRLFSERAKSLPVSSIKAATSHIMGGAGALEAIATALALKNGVLPPTINYETPDPECDLDYVPNEARAVEIRTALSNSSGIGGNNACVVLRRYE